MRTTRRYLGCCTRRCTSTTMVFSILALVTLPVSAVRSPRVLASCLAVSAGAFTGSGVITPSSYCATAISWTPIFPLRGPRASWPRRGNARSLSRRVAWPSIPARESGSSRGRDPFSSPANASALRLARWSAENAAGKSARTVPSAARAIRRCWLRESCRYVLRSPSLEAPRAGYELRGNGQLVARQRHGFLRRDFIHARHFKHDAARLHHANPALRSAFALAHAGFRGLFGEGLVRENSDPQFAAALDGARNGHAAGFNLPVGDPRVFHGLQSVLPERQIAAAPGFAVAPAAHLFPVLHFLGHQHRDSLFS